MQNYNEKCSKNILFYSNLYFLYTKQMKQNLKLIEDVIVHIKYAWILLLVHIYLKAERSNMFARVS